MSLSELIHSNVTKSQVEGVPLIVVALLVIHRIIIIINEVNQNQVVRHRKGINKHPSHPQHLVSRRQSSSSSSSDDLLATMVVSSCMFNSSSSTTSSDSSD